MKPALHIVTPDPVDGSPSAMLAELVPTLYALEIATTQARHAVRIQTQALARERGVAFIREESVRREFSPR